jgi:hypothetical protein
MRKLKSVLFFTLLIFSLEYELKSQNWTEPVNVSNMNDFILNCDFTIDNTGIIHCVWNLKYSANYGVIYYAKSEDDGLTWTEPVSVSQNINYYCTNPQIVHDSQNNLYVGYDLNDYSPQTWGSYTILVKKDSAGWSEPLTLSEGISTRLAIDNNDRLYVFWYMGSPHNGKFNYQYLEDDEWSELFCPYNNPDELTGINEIVVDKYNNLHCSGYYDPYGNLQIRVAYYFYDYSAGQWNKVHTLSNELSGGDNDIALDTAQNPHIVWEEFEPLYSWFNGVNWSINDTINRTDTNRAVIEIDEANNVLIAISEDAEEGNNLMYYHRPDGLNWESMIVDYGNNVIFTPEFEILNNQLYVVYDKSNSVPYGDIFISKLDLLSTTFEYNNSIVDDDPIQIYPNPFKMSTWIVFSLNWTDKINLTIKDLKGQTVKTLFEGIHTGGSDNVLWNGTNNQGQQVQPGIYFCFLRTNDYQYVTKIVYAP